MPNFIGTHRLCLEVNWREWCIALHCETVMFGKFYLILFVIMSILCRCNDRIVIVVVDDLGSFHVVNKMLVLSYSLNIIPYSIARPFRIAPECDRQPCQNALRPSLILQYGKQKSMHEQMAVNNWRRNESTKWNKPLFVLISWNIQTELNVYSCVALFFSVNPKRRLLFSGPSSFRPMEETHTNTNTLLQNKMLSMRNGMKKLYYEIWDSKQNSNSNNLRSSFVHVNLSTSVVLKCNHDTNWLDVTQLCFKLLRLVNLNIKRLFS